MSTRSVHQLLAALSYGDAVSSDALALQGHLRAAGFDSDIFAEHAHPRMAHQCRRLWEYGAVSSAETVCLFHFAIGSGAGLLFPQAIKHIVDSATGASTGSISLNQAALGLVALADGCRWAGLKEEGKSRAASGASEPKHAGLG